MDNNNWFMLAVVAVAFIAGYAIVGFVFQKIKKKPADDSKGSMGAEQQRPTAAHSGAQHPPGWAGGCDPAEDQEGLERRYFKVLGLMPGATVVDLKRASRELLDRYSADTHSQMDEQAKRFAEERTLEILEAYAYFQKKYGFR